MRYTYFFICSVFLFSPFVYAELTVFVSPNTHNKMHKMMGYQADIDPEQWQKNLESCLSDIRVFAPQTQAFHPAKWTFTSQQKFAQGVESRQALLKADEQTVYQLHADFPYPILNTEPCTYTDYWYFETDQVFPAVENYSVLLQAGQDKVQIEHSIKSQAGASLSLETNTEIDEGIYQVTPTQHVCEYLLFLQGQWFLLDTWYGTAKRVVSDTQGVAYAEYGITEQFEFKSIFEDKKIPVQFAKAVKLPVDLPEGVYQLDVKHQELICLDTQFNEIQRYPVLVETGTLELELVRSLAEPFPELSACTLPVVLRMSARGTPSGRQLQAWAARQPINKE